MYESNQIFQNELEAVAKQHGIPEESILSNSRYDEVFFARLDLAKRLRNTHNFTYSRIGRLLKRHHTTILHYFRDKDKRKYEKGVSWEKRRELAKVRKQKMLELAPTHTLAEIGKVYGISRQAVYALLGADYTPFKKRRGPKTIT